METNLLLFSVFIYNVCLVIPDVAEPSKFHLTLNIKTSSKFRPPRKSCLQVEYVTSLLTALRQWVGLMNIPKSLLACDILKPRKADYFCLNDPHSSIDSKVLETFFFTSLSGHPLVRQMCPPASSLLPEEHIFLALRGVLSPSYILLYFGSPCRVCPFYSLFSMYRNIMNLRKRSSPLHQMLCICHTPYHVSA